MKLHTISVFAGMLAAAGAAYGRSAGPPTKRTGAAVDGGLNCTACHRTFSPNSGAGRVRIDAVSYTPGVKQTITVTVEDPDAHRWGFQLIARLRSDETRQGGTFTVNDDTRVRCSPDERDAPCNGDLEFASHTSASTRPGTSGAGVFKVEWMPPAEDVGEISLYAAGNAANGDGTPGGDHIYTTAAVVRPVCNLTRAPIITDVMDAAAFRPLISPAALITIVGSGFGGPATRYIPTAADLVNGRLPTEFGCIALEIAGRRAPLLYVQQDQINAQAPILDSVGSTEVRVIANPGTSRELRGPAVQTPSGWYSPGLFAAAFAPVKAGDVAVIYGTGFGYSEPVWQPGEFPDSPAPVRDPYTILLAGVPLGPNDIVYAGLAGRLRVRYQDSRRHGRGQRTTGDPDRRSGGGG